MTWQGRTIFPSLNKASSCVTGSKPSEGMPTMTIKHQGWRRRRKKKSHKNNNERNQRHIRKKKNSDPSTVAAGSGGHPAAAESSEHLKPLSPAHTPRAMGISRESRGRSHTAGIKMASGNSSQTGINTEAGALLTTGISREIRGNSHKI